MQKEKVKAGTSASTSRNAPHGNSNASETRDRGVGGKQEPYPPPYHARMIAERLLKDLKILHLDKPIVCDRSAIWDILSKKYNRCRVKGMRHYWQDKQEIGGRQCRLIRIYNQIMFTTGKGSSRRQECRVSQLKDIKH